MELTLGVVGLSVGVCTQGLLKSLDQTGRIPCYWLGRVSGSLNPDGPSYSWYWDRCCVLLISDPMILGVLECLGVELPVGVVGLTAEFVLEVCSASLLF